MVTWHIDNDFTKLVRSKDRFNELSELEHKQLYSEVRNVILQGISDKLTGDVDTSVNSLLHWVLGFMDDKPVKSLKIASQGSYADFDIDFSKEMRGEVKQYLKGKYGDDRVCDVLTFNTLAAKAAVRSSQRALGYAIQTGADIAKHIPDVPGIKLMEAYDANKQLQEAVVKNDEAKKIWEIAIKLEGLPQALGVHACAFVITDKKTTEYVPQMISTKKDGADILTQYEYYDVEAMGCLKMDLLGLKTLDVIKGTVDRVRELRGIEIDIENIDVNDKGIYEVLNSGHNTGIFQFESNLFQGAVRQVIPTTVDELSDITSLNSMGEVKVGYMLEPPKALNTKV
jgi:DNA polymerase-3 subunit alpha